MGMSALPDMHARSPRTQEISTHRAKSSAHVIMGFYYDVGIMYKRSTKTHDQYWLMCL